MINRFIRTKFEQVLTICQSTPNRQDCAKEDISSLDCAYIIVYCYKTLILSNVHCNHHTGVFSEIRWGGGAKTISRAKLY